MLTPYNVNRNGLCQHGMGTEAVKSAPRCEQGIREMGLQGGVTQTAQSELQASCTWPLIQLPPWGCQGTTDREERGVSRKQRLDRGRAGRRRHPLTGQAHWCRAAPVFNRLGQWFNVLCQTSGMQPLIASGVIQNQYRQQWDRQTDLVFWLPSFRAWDWEIIPHHLSYYDTQYIKNKWQTASVATICQIQSN